MSGVHSHGSLVAVGGAPLHDVSLLVWPPHLLGDVDKAHFTFPECLLTVTV